MADWAEIPGFEGRYQVSRHGQVRYIGADPKRHGKLLRHRIQYNGKVPMLAVDLHMPGGKRFNRSEAALVVSAFFHPVTRKDLIVHKDGNPLNVELSNLSVRDRMRVIPKKKTPRRVAMVDRDGNVVQEYPTIRQAAVANYICVDSVARRCHGVTRGPLEYELITGCTFRFVGGDEKCTE